VKNALGLTLGPGEGRGARQLLHEGVREQFGVGIRQIGCRNLTVYYAESLEKHLIEASTGLVVCFPVGSRTGRAESKSFLNDPCVAQCGAPSPPQTVASAC
jgi:hypothetical protein